MWSLRAVVESAVQHARRALQQQAQQRQPLHAHTHTRPHNNANHKLSKCGSEKPGGGVQQRTDNGAGPSVSSSVVPVAQSNVVTRLVQGFVRKVSAPLWTEARRRATKRLVFGESAPFFALVGVTLVSEAQQGLVTKEDELEALCCNIREAISRAGWLHNPEYWKDKSAPEDKEASQDIQGNGDEHSLSLSHFTLGPVIGKGCNAAVYAAKWAAETGDGLHSPPLKRQRSESPEEHDASILEETGSEDDIFVMASEDLGDVTLNSNNLQEVLDGLPAAHSLEDITALSQGLGDITQTSQGLGDITHTSQEIGDITKTSQGFGDIIHTTQGLGNITRTSQAAAHSLEDITRRLGNLRDSDTSSTSPESREEQRRVTFKLTERRRKDHTTNDSNHGAASRPLPPTRPENDCGRENSLEEFPLAVKMMFNYEAESNAPAILRAMYKELTPARCVQMDNEQLAWQERLCGKLTRLPAHPNIVEMPYVFVDRVPLLEDSMNLYPNALPYRLNPSGYGRNMSLFCVMNRYDMSLREYLNRHHPSEHTSLLLLTQLLEALLHISSHNVAHRDLKSDNLLLSLSEGLEYPVLVVTDFGCSVASDSPTITVPFPSRDADPRQGNPALMAPEVITAVPGLLRSVNFTHSDIWAAGTLAFEIYGQDNPFCSSQEERTRKKSRMLDSATYKEFQVPRLPKTVPAAVRRLVHDLLRRNPRNRPSTNVAATLCQLILWAPSKWLSRHALTLPTHTEIMQWLLCLTTKVLCEARLSNTKDGHRRASGGKTKREEETGVGGNRDRRGGQLEYELVSTFLARVRYSDIIQAIKWNRAF